MGKDSTLKGTVPHVGKHACLLSCLQLDVNLDATLIFTC